MFIRISNLQRRDLAILREAQSRACPKILMPVSYESHVNLTWNWHENDSRNSGLAASATGLFDSWGSATIQLSYPCGCYPHSIEERAQSGIQTLDNYEFQLKIWKHLAARQRLFVKKSLRQKWKVFSIVRGSV